MRIQGIDGNLQVSQKIPFAIDEHYRNYLAGKEKSPFVGGYLTDVTVKPMVEKEYKLLPDIKLEADAKPTPEQVTKESIRYILNFTFIGKDGIQEYTEQVWDLKDNDPKYDNKNRMLNQRIAHLFEAYMGANTAAEQLSIEKVLGKKEATFENYFKGIANIFNTAKDGTPVFLSEGNKIPVRIKLTRNRSNSKDPNEIKMPLGNVVERIIQGATSSTLVLDGNCEFHIIEKPKATSGLGGVTKGVSSDFGPMNTQPQSGWDNVEEDL